ncbi:MAG: response regulator [Proteobacteria bacterium]|nr:response regulator [Pseudomonadota bacterium]
MEILQLNDKINMLSVLVVDDEEGIRSGAERILVKMDFKVSTAARGNEALDILNKEEVSIVLLDLKMPGIDGMEVLRRIRETYQNILVIIITGYATVETAIEAMKQGAYDFIAKPFEPDHLRIVVNRAREKIRLKAETEILERERRKTLADLGTEKSRIRTIIESLPNGIVVTNSKGHVALVNPAFFKHIGLDPADNPAGEHIEHYVKDERFCKLVMEISQGEYNDIIDVPTCEFSPVHGKFLIARGRPVLGDEKECLGAVVAIEDITAMKVLDRLKSEFVAKVSHELRSPLSTIHEQIAVVLKDMAGEESNDDKLVLARAKEKTSGLIALIGDLLDLSRIEAGLVYQKPKPINIDVLLKSIVDFLGARAKSKQQSLVLKLPEVPLPSLTIDPMAIESIFGNLITNAINYTNEGGEITVTAETDGKNIIVDVKDNGFGIDPSYHEKIFDKFFRVKNEKTRYITGTGLGLPIVKGLLNDLGGSISLKSTPGNGCVFTVSLPVKNE